MLGQFTIDFLATVPFDSIAEVVLGDAGLFKFLGALKLVRVLRLSRIITYLRSTMEVKETLKLLQIIFYLVMYVHCFGCMWWLLVSDSEKWIPLLWYGDSSNWFIIYDSSIFH